MHACKLQTNRCLTSSKHCQDREYITIQPVSNFSVTHNPSFSNRSQHSTVQHIMGYYTSHRKSSFHWTAEAYLAFGIGLARRVSHAERRSSYAERRSSRRKSRRTCTSSPSSRKPKRTSSPSPHRSKSARSSYPCYHRIVTPEPTYSHHDRDYSFHEFCVASNATYARLAARLERLRGFEEDVAAYVRERDDRIGRVADGLREEVGSLEETLEAMRRKIDEGEGGWDGSGKAFLVGGRWATFL